MLLCTDPQDTIIVFVNKGKRKVSISIMNRVMD